MKISALTIYLFAAQALSGQFSWFPTGATWTYDVSWYGGEAVVKLEILPGDTLIDNHVSKIMMMTSIVHQVNEAIDTNVVFRTVYEEVSKVYVGSNGLLYDFTRLEGDTLDFMYFGGFSPDLFILDTIGSLEMNGIPMQFQDIRFPDPFDSEADWWTMRVIEGIGSINTFFFWDQTVLEPPDAPHYYLRCYEDSQAGTLHFNGQTDCDALPWTTSSSETITFKTNIYPNPATSEIHIQLSDPTYTEISIMDIYGRNLLKINTVGSNVLETNISHLAEGIYFIQGITNEGTISYLGKFLKRN